MYSDCVRMASKPFYRVSNPDIRWATNRERDANRPRRRRPRHIRHLLDTDRSVRDFFECETEVIPSFYINRMKQDWGEFRAYLPEGTIHDDPNAYLKKIEQQILNAIPHA